MNNYEGLSVNKAIKMVRARNGHRKQQKGRVEGLISLLAATPSAWLMTDLQEELESYIEKTNDISVGLQYLMLQDNGEEGIGQYERDMAAMREEDADLITCARAAMVNAQSQR